MISTEAYKGYQFQDLGILFKRTNVQFYKYLTEELGLELDLSKKDQQKIYFHFFIKQICSEIMYHTTYKDYKVVFYLNIWDICDIHKKMIKKIISLFGIKIFESHYNLEEFIGRLETKECDILDKFELFLQKETKPKTFKHIKKFLDKEGFVGLSGDYFQDVSHKMAVIC